MYNNKKKKRKE